MNEYKMQTSKINIELMNEMQVNKELIFNEAMVKIDSLTNLIIEDFINEENINNDNSFIILNGENKNKISYININSNERQYFMPQKVLLVFIVKKNNFYMFDSQKWEPLSFHFNIESNKNVLNDYIGISNEFYINSNSSKFTYLYIQGDTKIMINEVKYNEFTLLIKQNCNTTYNLQWGDNILWPEKGGYVANKIKNNIDIIKFYKLAKEDSYIASYETNYQYGR
jgi:hypothetical protein